MRTLDRRARARLGALENATAHDPDHRIDVGDWLNQSRRYPVVSTRRTMDYPLPPGRLDETGFAPGCTV